MNELNENRIKPIRFSLLILILFYANLALGSSKPDTTYRVMFYNVENLFDTEDDPETIDEEFLPEGDRFWNERKFNLKLNRIFQVITAAGEGNLPAVIGLCEIENRKVLELLLQNTLLGKMGYSIIQKESPDERGIDVAFLYRTDLFRPISYKAIPVEDQNDSDFKTRDILYIQGIFVCDTLHFFINHWPSKYAGIVETKPLRALAAKTLKQELQIVLNSNESKVIIMGDFNDSPFDESITKHLNAKTNFDSIQNNEIYNLAFPLAEKGIGSNKFHGKWELIDQIMVNGSLLQSKGIGTRVDLFKVFDHNFLKEKDTNYLGDKPFRTYIGFKYNNGFSDHFPVLLDLYIN